MIQCAPDMSISVAGPDLIPGVTMPLPPLLPDPKVEKAQNIS